LPDDRNRQRQEKASRPRCVSPCSEAGPQNPYTVLAVCGLLLLAVVLVFGQTLQHKFINYDDDEYVYANPQVAPGLTTHGIARAFTQACAGNWHPLTCLSHMLDCQLYGLQPWGHHLSNVLLHAASTILLFLVLRRMTGDLWPSAFVAALFAIHPLHVESVAWVAERKDVLSGLFFMLTLWAYVGYVRHPFSLARYLSVVALFALGLMAKPMLVTLPCVLLLLDYWPLGRFSSPPAKDTKTDQPRSRLSIVMPLVVEKLPLLVLTAVSCVVMPLTQKQAIESLDAVPLSARVANALVSYVAYLGQLFYPIGLAVLYPHPGSALPTWQVAGALVLMVSISAVVLVWRRRRPYLFVGWLWYVGMLVPVIGLVQLGSQSRADRYTYLTQIGLYMALAWGASEVSRHWPYRRWVCGVTSVSVIVIMAACAWRQTSYWRDSETLWTRALACTSGNAPAHYNLGVALSGRGRVDEAIAQYRKALKIKPDKADAHNNLAMALVVRGEVDAAIAHYQKALEIRPDLAEVHYNLGVALADRGEVDAAIAHYKMALEINPYDADTHNNLGKAMSGRGQVDEAITQYQKALEIRPSLAEAHNNLGMALAGCGQVDEAIACYQKALEIRPDLAEAHNNLGNALVRRGQVDEAIAQYRQALQVKPDFAEAHYNLANALARCGEFDTAIVHYRKALEIKPNDTRCSENLASVLSDREKILRTLATRRETLRSRPDDTALLNDIAWMLATNPNASVRNGAEAVELAKRASKLSGGKEPAILGTLAAAYAETGRFAEAVETAQRALALATNQSRAALAHTLRAQLKLYQHGSPYREGRKEGRS
jgi:protein O-mannosyl-transferase